MPERLATSHLEQRSKTGTPQAESSPRDLVTADLGSFSFKIKESHMRNLDFKTLSKTGRFLKSLDPHFFMTSEGGS